VDPILKTVKVLCVVKDNRLLTRVVRQDVSCSRQELGVLGSLEIKMVNSPEFRPFENTLFLRGIEFSCHHKVDISYLTTFDMIKAVTLIKKANDEYHEKISVQNSNR
jgi:hypothetical protein